jgi:type IV secretion system protein VirB4
VAPLASLFREYVESRPFHTLVNVFGFADNETMLMKSGDVAVAMLLRGPDAECLEPHQLDQIQACVRSAYHVFDERFVVNTYWIKRSNPALDREKCEDPFASEVDCNRCTYLAKKGARLYSYEHYLVITRRVQWQAPRIGEQLRRFLKRPRASALDALSTPSRMAHLSQPLGEAISALHRDVNSFIEQVRDDFSVRVLDKKQTFAFLRRLLNPDRAKAETVSLKHDTHVDFFAVDSELACHRNHLQVGNFHLKLQTLKEPPAQTFGHMFRDLCDVEADIIVVTEWNPLSTARARRKIRAKIRFFHSTKRSLLSQIGSEQNSEREKLFDEGKEAVGRDLGQCTEEMEMNGLQIGEFSLTVVVLGETLEAARRASAEIARVFGAHEGIVNEETYNGLNAFIAALPGGFPFNLRKILITNRNYVDMGLWFLPSEGERRNAFLGAPCLAAFETEDHGLFHFNLHVEDVGHTLVFGPTGKGKSFILNFLIAHAQKYQPYTFIIDAGGSYRWLTEALNGSCVSVRPETMPFSINPFALEPTSSNTEFQYAFTKLLVESLGGRVSDADEKEVFEAVKSLQLLPPAQRRLSTLANTVPRTVGKYLRRWTEGEQYGSYFDHAEDSVSFARFQCFDFEGMEQVGPPLEALFFYLFHRMNEIIASPALATVLKLTVIDEAWVFFKHPVTRTYIEKALKTSRKKNGAMILATQSLQDLPGAEILRPVVDNCPTKILLANPALDGEFYGKVLRLTPTEQDKVRQLKSKKQFLLKREGLSKTLNLNVDPKSHWIFTTDPYEAKRRQELIDKVGLHAALEILSGGSQ